MDPVLVKVALAGVALLGCIGLFFGIGLALAAHKFAVRGNPKVEEVLEVLAGAQCGGCGYPGCEGYAEAVVNDPDVSPNLCFPGKAAVAEAVAEITGKKTEAVDNMVAHLRCSRTEGQVKEKYRYVGFQSCTAANLAFGGPQSCPFACIGLGECARVCPFGAILMVDGIPVVDPQRCVGCEKCVKTCPKKSLELIPVAARVRIPCSTRGSGKMVKEVCLVGCVSCRMCIKACPAGAVDWKEGAIVIDHARCIEYGTECAEACVAKCPRHIFRRCGPQSVQEADARSAA
jgi:electron transport complex protein RnfB